MIYNQEFMAEAVKMAEQNIHYGGGPFGAIIVKDNEIVAKGCNQVTLKNDPTAHAEIEAIRAACLKLETFNLQGCEIYTTCEPCPMCLSAIYWAHIDKVYYGMTKKDAASIGFDDDFIYKELNLPVEQRKLTIIQRDKSMTELLFRIWENKEDKIKY